MESRSVEELAQQNFLETQNLYAGHFYAPQLSVDAISHQIRMKTQLYAEYSHVKDLSVPIPSQTSTVTPIQTPQTSSIPITPESAVGKTAAQSQAITIANSNVRNSSQALSVPAHRRPPVWHAPWEIMRVISGHTGWVRCCDVDPSNEWFATGSADRTIIVWDLASGTRKVTLTGHIATVRDLVISARQPYLFSVGEDKMVKCWDLEANQVVRHYHGHLNGVYCAALHPTIDVLMTGGRDASVRVWDIRTKAEAMILTGHKNTIGAILTQGVNPQVVSGSYDSTIRLWDLAAGKTDVVLTNHKKAIRGLAMHPKEFSFLSASADNIKQWQFPHGRFIKNFSGQRAIVNSLAVNSDGVTVSGGDDGSMYMWDWKTGHCFQKLQTIVQPGSLESEAGIFCAKFDYTGCRLITCEADKSIKIWREIEDATPETHPNEKWQPSLKKKRW